MSNPFFLEKHKKIINSEYRLLIFLSSMLSVDIKWSRCQYGIPISRISNAFVRRDHDVTHTETNSKVGCKTESAMTQICFPSTEHHKLGEIPNRIDLFEAIEELCKYYINREPANFSLFICAASSSFRDELFIY